MTPIALYSWNYNAADLISKIGTLLRNQEQFIQSALQRSVTYVTSDGKKDHVITRLDVLGRDDAPVEAKTLDYETICLDQRPITLDQFHEILGRLQNQQLKIGDDIFEFPRGFGFSDQYEPSANAYSELPGRLFDVNMNQVQLSTAPLLHHELPSYDSVYEPIKDFLGLKQFNDYSDSRLGHLLLYVPNFHARLANLSLQGENLRIQLASAVELDSLTLDIAYGNELSKDQQKKTPTALDQDIVLKFSPNSLRIWLFLKTGELIDFHEETSDYSRGANPVLPKRNRITQPPQFVLEGLEDEESLFSLESPNTSPKDSRSKKTLSSASRDVFLIHGHHTELKQTVASFLRKLKLNPIILDEQANKGLTIIEKFEAHSSSVGFAIALLTGDDLGRKISDDNDLLRPRARQNVILEFGYFMGRLGREKVCGLLQKGVEIPSDYSGVLYIETDNENWQFQLVRELKAAGLEFDANLAFE